MDTESQIMEVSLQEIIPNRFQPRLSFDEKAISELAESIKQHGIIQPLVLRRIGDKYEIIAGERRYKAAGLAGLSKVPAVISNADDNTSAEVALVENIQRKNLTAIEEARSFKNLLDKGYLTQEELAKKMGLSQSGISNKLRLLNLDEEIQEALLSEKISERHARSLLKIIDKDEQKKWLQRILRERMTVRQLDLELKKLFKDTDDEANIPLVNLTPNIEDIKNNATDLNPLKDSVTLDEFQTLQKDLPSEEETVVDSEKMPRKFFNFLEDEAVNMNVNNDQAIENSFGLEPNIPSSPNETKPNNFVEVLDMPLPLMKAQSEEDNDESFVSEDSIFTDLTPKMDSEKFPADDSETIEPSVNNQTYISPAIVDPVNMIDKLDPAYESKLKEAVGLDLKTAINTVRDCVKQMNEKGFIVDTDEIDLENNYQIIINIDKSNF